MTIKEAFQKLSKVTNAGIKNPWFVIRNLGQTFADVADKISYNEMITSKKLWVNANPNTSYSGGDVTVDNSGDYDAFIIFLKDISNDVYHSAMCLKAYINDSTQHSYSISHINTTDKTIIECIRKVSLTQASDSSDVVFTFTGCSTVTIDAYGTSTATSTTNSVLIPGVVIGVKFNS